MPDTTITKHLTDAESLRFAGKLPSEVIEIVDQMFDLMDNFEIANKATLQVALGAAYLAGKNSQPMNIGE